MGKACEGAEPEGVDTADSGRGRGFERDVSDFEQKVTRRTKKDFLTTDFTDFHGWDFKPQNT
jgi:hypothetical protein